MTESLGLGMGEAYERLELLRLTVEGMPAALDDRLAKLTAQAQQAVQAARGAENAAESVARTSRRHAAWLAGGLVLGLLVVGNVAWWLAREAGHQQGLAEGYAAGIQETRREEAAASWANTPSGRLALSLDTAAPGTLARLVQCDGPGWIRDKDKSGQKTCRPGAGQTWPIPP